MLACVEDKHRVKVGEPACPVAAVGWQVLVGRESQALCTWKRFCWYP